MRQLPMIHTRLAESLFYPSAAASGFVLILVIGQTLMLGDFVAGFLIWNLILAWIPYVMAMWAEASAQRSLWRAILPGIAWLLFLPNAPYLLTDLIHLERFGFVWWYDLGMLIALAWSGALLGVASLFIMQRIVRERLGTFMSWVFVLTSCGLNGIGIYVGRFLRWNSWDILFNPNWLISDTLYLLNTPAYYPQMIGVSGLFAGFLALGYLTLMSVRRVAA
nr:DUF1361 domain-containing protein [Oscillochloris trichoides]